ncbi:MAG: ribbon-helix-helix domain-containing protein [Cyanobium sp.]
MNDRLRVLQRQPRRVSITLSHYVHEALLSRSEEEGRSVSTLCAFLLEEALHDKQRESMATSPMTSPMTAPTRAHHADGRLKVPGY